MTLLRRNYTYRARRYGVVEGRARLVAVHQLLHQQLGRDVRSVRRGRDPLSEGLVHHEVRGRRGHPLHGSGESGGREVKFGDTSS